MGRGKNPFDRIVGPDGEWRVPVPGVEVGPREEFMLRCLNAAVNLRGVLTYGEFCDVYNRYAPDHDEPVSNSLDEDELSDFLIRVAGCREGDGSAMDALIDEFGMYFVCWRDHRTGEKVVAAAEMFCHRDADGCYQEPEGDAADLKSFFDKRVAAARDVQRGITYPDLDEDLFLSFEFPDDDDDEYPDGAGDDGETGEEVRVEDLPPAKFTGPFDFKSVKDPSVRDKLLWDYEGVQLVTRDFVRREVMRELTGDERRAAAKRLGFKIDGQTGFVADPNLDMVVGDFAAMMDDQHGEPAIKRIMKRKDKLEDDLGRAASEYYENYRYTWLEVLASKAGVGLKCRDLMTCEDIFLMETSLSRDNVKGMTICAGIAPMGEVYLSLGVIHPANFENPATILKIVLTYLGLPTELPVRLSFADQARFAAETIRRVHANGKFDTITYGTME